MATKKLQNFVKSKVSGSSNITSPFSKARLKSDSLEEPLIFDNLEKELSHEDVGETNYAINANNSNSEENNIYPTSEIAKCNDESVVLSYNLDLINTGSINNPIRVGVEKFGKSVNIALKDAHLAINAIMKDSQKKKSIRKPSDVTKSRNKFSNFSRKHYLPMEDCKTRSRSLTRENNKMENGEDVFTLEEASEDPIKETHQMETETLENENVKINTAITLFENETNNNDDDAASAAVATNIKEVVKEPEENDAKIDHIIEPVHVASMNNNEPAQLMNFTSPRWRISESAGGPMRITMSSHPVLISPSAPSTSGSDLESRIATLEGHMLAMSSSLAQRELQWRTEIMQLREKMFRQAGMVRTIQENMLEILEDTVEWMDMPTITPLDLCENSHE